MTQDIYVIGDTHTRWDLLNKFICKKQPSIILQVGDYGYWPSVSGTYTFGRHTRYLDGSIRKKKKWHQCGVKNKDTVIHFCDGNHDDHWEFNKLTDNEICPGIFYQKRGNVITLPDGRNVLFMGGAESIDKNARKLGVDWFPEETITQKDTYALPDCKIDIVISHTCPSEFIPELRCNFAKGNDPSCKALSFVLDTYKPALWYFGHWHTYKTGYTKGTRWTCLNMAAHAGWFEKLI